MKKFIHVIHQSVEELYVKIPELHTEIVELELCVVPKEVMKERSDLLLTRQRLDPVVRLYADVESPTEGLDIKNWEVRQFAQDQINNIVFNLIRTMTNSLIVDVMMKIKKALPDVPDVMIGISILKYCFEEMN